MSIVCLKLYWNKIRTQNPTFFMWINLLLEMRVPVNWYVKSSATNCNLLLWCVFHCLFNVDFFTQKFYFNSHFFNTHVDFREKITGPAAKNSKFSCWGSASVGRAALVKSISVLVSCTMFRPFLLASPAF